MNKNNWANEYRQHSFWLDTVPDSLSPRPALAKDLQVDVVIAGAGYTGLWTAWYLKKHQPDLRIAILEAEIAGFGASGRNGGWCSHYLSRMDNWLENPDTRASALHLQRLMMDAVREVGRVASATGIDCHYERSGMIEFATNFMQMQRLKKEIKWLRCMGWGEGDFRWLEQTEAEKEIRAAGILGAITSPHVASIHPARLARGLAEVVVNLGVQLYEQSPVTGVSATGMRTAGGNVAADIVLMATEAYTRTIPGYRRKIIPIHSMMVATQPLDDSVFESLGLSTRKTFGDLSHSVTYGLRTADNRIAFGCRGNYYFGSGIHSRFDQKSAVFSAVRNTLKRIFPQLGETEFTHAWGGAFGSTRSVSPTVSYNNERRFGWAGGYVGNGVAAANLAARTLADLVLGRDTERVHTPWVTTQGELRKGERLWEQEPLRWLGVTAVRKLALVQDWAELRDSRMARVMGKLFKY